MAKRCKYIYKGKTYSKEEFMALLAGGEYENILAEYDQAPEVEVKEGREVVDTVKTFKAKSSVGGKFNVNLFADLTDEQGKTILDKLREEGYVVDNADIFSFADSDNVFTMVPDNKMVGDLSYGKDKEGKDRVVLQGNGGIYFAVKFNNDGTFWASTPQIANSIIKQINAAIDKNGSPAYVVVNKGSNRKVLSSVDGMIAAVDTIAYMVEDGDIPLSVFRNEMSSAIKKSGYTGKDLFPMNISAKDMHKSIKDLFMKAEFTSFEKRKEVVTNLIKNIFDKKSNKDLVNFESLSEKLGFPLKNKEDIIDSFGKIQEEGFISEVPSQSAYAVIEIPSKLKIEDESSKDPSERRHIAYAGVMKTEDGQRVKVHMLKDRLNWRDFMTDSKGTPLSEMEEKSALGKAGHGQVPFIKAGIKAKASKGVSAIDIVSKDKFSNNASAAVNRVRNASGEDGATLNLDGTDYTNGGLVVPAGSFNVSQQEVSEDGLYDFLKNNEENISSDIFKIGLYKFPDRAEVSYDLNIVIPREHRDIALEFGKLAGQESLFDLDSYENIKTGSDGKNPISFTPKQLASIAKDLSNGILPDVEGMLKGDRSDAGDALKDVESTAKALEGKTFNYIKNAAKSILDFVGSVENKNINTNWADWFLGENKDAKNRIAFDIQSNPQLRSALMSNLYDLWKKETKSNISFDEFLNTEITLYRGGEKGFKNEVDVDGFNTWELTKEGAKKFAKGEDVVERKIQVKKLYGAVDIVGGEVEVLEKTRVSDVFAKQIFEQQQWVELISVNLSSDSIKQLTDLTKQSKFNEALSLSKRLISEAYHKAKADGSNPELVQAVEDLLGQPTTLQEGVKGQAITDPTLLFKKSQELFDKISDAAGGSKKRSSAEERRKFMDDNPDIKYIDENMAYIYKQIEDNNLGKKEGNCPL